jgi:hypothetical protein
VSERRECGPEAVGEVVMAGEDDMTTASGGGASKWRRGVGVGTGARVGDRCGWLSTLCCDGPNGGGS